MFRLPLQLVVLYVKRHELGHSPKPTDVCLLGGRGKMKLPREPRSCPCPSPAPPSISGAVSREGGGEEGWPSQQQLAAPFTSCRLELGGGSEPRPHPVLQLGSWGSSDPAPPFRPDKSAAHERSNSLLSSCPSLLPLACLMTAVPGAGLYQPSPDPAKN